LITSEQLASRCAADPEFRLAARFWNRGFVFVDDEGVTGVRVVDGRPETGPVVDGRGVVKFGGDHELWESLLRSVAPRLYSDIAFAAVLGGQGLGHFPMAENPGAFITHVLPVLKDIRTNRS
jgi:hypothetical protein